MPLSVPAYYSVTAQYWGINFFRGPTTIGGGVTCAKAEFHVTLDGIETILEVWTRNLSNKDIRRVGSELAESARTRVTEGGRITTRFRATLRLELRTQTNRATVSSVASEN